MMTTPQIDHHKQKQRSTAIKPFRSPSQFSVLRWILILAIIVSFYSNEEAEVKDTQGMPGTYCGGGA